MRRNQGLVLNTQCLLSAWSVKLDNGDSENRERERGKKKKAICDTAKFVQPLC